MRYRKLGKTGPEVSEIGFGSWAIGGAMWGGKRDDEARVSLERAFERGVNFYDTALVYGDGHSERLVGEFARKHPDKVYVATKVPPKAYNWPAPQDAPLELNFPAPWIIECAEKSLKNLGLERIDLLQLHVWAEAWTHQDEWREALEKLRAQGKVRLTGVSINSHDPKSALGLVKERMVDALQVFYNIFDQSPEDELFPACIEAGVGVLARVPFDESSLTGKLTEETTFPDGDFRAQYFGGKLLKETVRRVEALRPIVEGAAGSMARGALRYCLSHPAVSTVIPGMRTPHQVDENSAASDDGPLPPEVVEALHAHRWVRRPY
ncbi:MAG: aldo/keto reductase [Myxococcales bacterium]|nr:aldo/keto reductase [Myxococcales bacterium]